jgi:hypothetical protein
MNRQPTPKVIGAFVIGFALVSGAYVLSNFGEPPSSAPTVKTTIQTQKASLRTAIPITDEDGNKIEDWRDEFVVSEPIVVNSEGSGPYEPPTTLTGQTGITFFQDIVRSHSFGPAINDEQVVSQTIGVLKQKTSQGIYDTPDVKLLHATDGESIRTYANAVALAIMENSATDLDTELLILRDITNRRDESRIAELQDLAELYRLTRDAVLEIPVPKTLLKEHLDLINALHAVHHDVLGMTLTFEDPAYALMRVKRYQDDILGMVIALENLYLVFEPHASLFTVEDPAVFFVDFNPTNRIRI